MKSLTSALVSRLAVPLALALAAPAAMAQDVDAPNAGWHGVAMVTAQTSGTVARYIVGPMGHVRGFVLDNGAIVFVHGQGDALAQQLPVGQSVRVEGTAPATTPHVIHGATVFDASGNVLAAPQGHGRQPGAGFSPDPNRRAMHRAQGLARLEQLPQRSITGVVQTVIPGPRGGVRGFLLADGTSVFLGHPLARQLRQRGVRPGETVQVSGRGGQSAYGAGLFAEQLTFADGTSLSAPAPAAPSAP